MQIVDSAGGAAWEPLHVIYAFLFLDPGPLIVAVVALHFAVGLTLSYALERIIWRSKVAV